jgi:hypothetical protein
LRQAQQQQQELEEEFGALNETTQKVVKFLEISIELPFNIIFFRSKSRHC